VQSALEGQSASASLGDTDLNRDQVGDMIAASEARTDVKFAHLEGKIDLLIEETRHTRTETAQELTYVRERLAEGRQDQRSTRNTIFATVIPSAVAVAGVVVALWLGAREPQAAAQPQQPPALTYNQSQVQPPLAPQPKALPAPTEKKH
jgi:hypothetical protein